MPLRSQAQRRFLWATDKKLARRFEDHTPKGKKLPQRVHKKKAEDSGPPGLRAASHLGPNCSTCKHFQAATSSCQKYATQVGPQAACDAYEAPALDVGQIENAMPPTNTLEPTLSPEGTFKAGFLLRCLEDGLTPEQIAERAEKAAAALEKQADGNPLWDFLKGITAPFSYLGGKAVGGLADMGGAALVGAPLAAGAVGGMALGKMRNAADAEDADELKMENRVARYRQMADDAMRQAKLKHLQHDRPGELVQIA